MLVAVLAILPTQMPDLIIENVNIVHVSENKIQQNATVLVKDGRITEITGEETSAIRRIDGKGKFLIPGLWDMHIHWYDKESMSLFTANGVTGVRVMFGAPMHLAWKKEFEEGKAAGPRMIVGSPIVDGPKPIWPGSYAVSNAEQAEAALDKIKTAGYDFVKVYSLVPPDAYTALMEGAKKRGLRVEGHVPGQVSAREASEKGQHSMEHLGGLGLPSSSKEDELRAKFSQVPPAVRYKVNEEILASYSEDKASGLFGAFKKNNTWQCPTLVVLRNLANLDRIDPAKDDRIQYLPKFIVNSWNPNTDFRLKDRTPEMYESARKGFETQKRMVRDMARVGVPLIAGTDALNPYCMPGFSLHDELALMVEAGLTPAQALATATVNPARFLGQEGSWGDVKAGQRADLVLLEGNPLEDIANTKKIAATIQGGKLYERADLDAILQKMKGRNAGASGPAGICPDH